MGTTRLSTRGQAVIPKELRESYHWQTGQELDVVDTGGGLLLKTRSAGKAVSWRDVVGCLHHLAKKRPIVIDEEMQVAVRTMAAKRHERGRHA